jgi:pimeloyl-ACP methyl ester carboxylesterase
MLAKRTEGDRCRPMMAVRAMALSVLAAVVLATTAGSVARADTNKAYTITVAGRTVAFRVRGADKDDPYLLILAGGPTESSQWFYPWAMTSGFEDWLNVVYLTPDANAAPVDPGPFLEQIEAIRVRLKVQKWYVLGYSWGAMSALEYVSGFPNHVIGFIDMDGVVSAVPAQSAILTFASSWYSQRAAVATNDAGRMAAANGAAATGRASEMPPGAARLRAAVGLLAADPKLRAAFCDDDPTKDDEYTALVGEVALGFKEPVPVLPLLASAGSASDADAVRDDTPLLAKVGVPTLVLSGEDDRLVSLAQARTVLSAIPGATFLSIRDAGLVPFAEQGGETLAAIEEFLQAQEPSLSDSRSGGLR